MDGGLGLFWLIVLAFLGAENVTVSCFFLVWREGFIASNDLEKAVYPCLFI